MRRVHEPMVLRGRTDARALGVRARVRARREECILGGRMDGWDWWYGGWKG
jgi:hypothetical protein